MNLRLLLGYLLWLTLFVPAGYGQKPKSQIAGELRTEQSSASPVTASAASPSASSSPITGPSGVKVEQSFSIDLSRIESSDRPSVIWVTVFDSLGKLLRTQTGFFISSDGRLVTTARAIENGINAVAKTADGGIYNVSGILAASTELDLVILQADVKRVSYLVLNPNANLAIGARVALVGSGLAGSDGAAREAIISTEEPDRLEIAATVSASSVGSPIVDVNGEAVGIVVSGGEKAVVRPSSSIKELLSQVASGAVAKWPATAEISATPKPTPKPRLVYAPAPSFPAQLSWRGVSASGRFRLTFDARGIVTNVQTIQSTGNALFDQAAIDALRQWKCTPGHGWAVTVPVTFQLR